MAARAAVWLLAVSPLWSVSPGAADEGPADQFMGKLCRGERIARIDVKGTRRVTEEDVRVNLGFEVGTPCTRSSVERASRRLWELGLFADVQIEGTSRNAGEIDLTVVIAERPAVGQVRYEGNKAISDDDLAEKVKLEEGTILDEGKVRAQIKPLKQHYVEEGYYLAEVEYELVPSRKNPDEVDIVFSIDEGASTRVRSILFTGNKEISDADLRAVIQLSETHVWSFVTSSNKFDTAALEEDLLRIQALYYDKGYLTATVGTPDATLSTDKRFIDIRIPVQEGPRFRVSELAVVELDDAGNPRSGLVPPEDLVAPFQGQKGTWFSRSKIAQGIQSINSIYRDAGYAFAEINPETAVNDAKREVGIKVTIQRGPKVYIERINIRGNTTTRDKVIRREFKIAEGDLYSQRLVERSRARAQALGFFESINISETRGAAPDLIVLNVEVTERSTGTFQLGAGFSSIESFILTGQVQQQNFLGRGQSLSLQLQLSGIRQLVQVRFVEPYFLDTEWSLGLDAFKTIRQFQDFTRDSTGGGFTFGHPVLIDELRLFLQYRAEWVEIDSQTGGVFGRGFGQGFNIFRRIPLANLFRDGLTSSLRLTLNWDSRDNRLLPNDGIYGSISSEVAEGFMGSDNIFARHTAIGRFYKPVWKGLVLKLNTEVGYIHSRVDRGVPIFERFFLGGIFNLRGFPLQSVGPRVGLPLSTDPNGQVSPEGVVIGGNLQAFYNLELEFPIVDAVGIRGVIFTDGGNVWNTESELCQLPQTAIPDGATNPCGVNPLAIRTSYGFGLRWLSPLGPLRFEWGLPFRPRSYEAPIRFEFTIGNFF